MDCRINQYPIIKWEGMMTAKEKLLDAAEKCLLEKGCHASCVKTIAEVAGVNHGLIHHYYGSKEGLFVELSKKYFETIKPSPLLSLKTEEDVMAYLKEHIIPSSKMMLHFRAMSSHMPGLRKELISMSIELRCSLKDMLGIEEEQALILMGSVLGLGFHSFLEPAIDIENHIQIIVNLILKKWN